MNGISGVRFGRSNGGVGALGYADGGNVKPRAELRSRDPSLLEKAEAALGEYLGGDRDAYARARKLTAPFNAEVLPGVTGADVAHVGAYATPAAPAVAAYDLYGLGRSISEPVKDLWSGLFGTDETPLSAHKRMTRDEFFASRRKPIKSLSTSQTEAENSVRTSKAYEDAVARGQRTTAQRMIDAARSNAAKSYEAEERGRAGEDARIEADWLAELSDRERARREELSKPWMERHPTVAKALVATSYVLPAVLASRGFSRVAAQGEEILGRLAGARAAGNFADEAKVLGELSTWRNMAPVRNAWTTAKAAVIPAELRLAGDIWDSKTLPPDAEAKKDADERLRKIFGSVDGAMTELGSSLMTGIISAGTGGMAAKALKRNSSAQSEPRDRAKAELRYINGVRPTDGRSYRALSPDEAGPLLETTRRRAFEARPPEALSEFDRGIGALGTRVPPAASTTTLPASSKNSPSFGQPETTTRSIEGLPPIPQRSAERAPIGIESSRGPSGYTPEVRDLSQREFSRALDDVSSREANLYRPDTDLMTERISSALEKDGLRYAPRALRKRVEGSVEAFDAVRKAGGDPLSDAARPLMFGRSTTLAAPIAVPLAGVALSDGFDTEDLPPLGYATGGAVKREPVFVGPVVSNVPGRTDRHPVTVEAGSYVFPSDFVSALGEGNSQAGMQVIESMLTNGPDGVAIPLRQKARGGLVPIIVAGGEFIAPPHALARWTDGNQDDVHDLFDSWVTGVRKKTIDTLKQLPPPAKG